MKRFTAANTRALPWIFAVMVGSGLAVLPFLMGNAAVAKDRQANTQDGVRVEDLPKPVPSLMKTIQGIGNRVGNEISKATSNGAKAVKKAVKRGKKQGGRKPER